MGIALSQVWISPKNPASARHRSVADFMDQALNRFFIDPFFLGTYPSRVLSKVARRMPKGFEGDLGSMKGSVDFVGINYYERLVYRWSLLQPYTHAREYVDPHAPRSAMWESIPRASICRSFGCVTSTATLRATSRRTAFLFPGQKGGIPWTTRAHRVPAGPHRAGGEGDCGGCATAAAISTGP